MKTLKNSLYLILAFCLILGQLIRLPFLPQGNITLIDLITFFLVFYSVIKSKLKFKKPPNFIIAGLIFWLTGLISLIFSPLPLTAAEKLTSTLYGLRFLQVICLGFFVAAKLIPISKEQLIKTLIISGLGISILGILQFLFLPNLSFLTTSGWDPHLYRLASTFLDPNFTGGFLALTLIWILLFPQTLFSRYHRWIFALVYLGLLLTFSRSAYLCFGVGFLLISILQRSTKLFGLTILLSLILFLSFREYQVLVAQPLNVSRTKSAESRVSTWQQGLAIFGKNPFLGIGYNSYRYGLKDYHLAPQSQIDSHGGTSNDSSLLQVLDTSGILGLLIYLRLIWEIFQKGWKVYLKNSAGLALLAMTAGIVAQSFFINTLFYPFFLVPWILTAAVVED